MASSETFRLFVQEVESRIELVCSVLTVVEKRITSGYAPSFAIAQKLECSIDAAGQAVEYDIEIPNLSLQSAVFKPNVCFDVHLMPLTIYSF